jgi:hypothetical protein
MNIFFIQRVQSINDHILPHIQFSKTEKQENTRKLAIIYKRLMKCFGIKQSNMLSGDQGK